MEEKFKNVLRRSRVGSIISSLFIAAFGWGQYIAVVFFHFHLIPHEQGMHVETTEPVFSLWLALAATIIAIIVLLVSLSKAQILLNRGVEGQARVVKVSAAKKHGIRPVTYAFLVDGKEYTVRKDTDAADADLYDDSTVVSVVYDPARPTRCRIMS
jgi:heme exporter protein D